MASDRTVELIVQAWEAVVGGAASPTPAPLVEITGIGGQLGSRLPVEDVAVACVGAALMAASALAAQRGGSPVSAGLDRGGVAAGVRIERHFRSGGGSAG